MIRNRGYSTRGAELRFCPLKERQHHLVRVCLPGLGGLEALLRQCDAVLKAIVLAFEGFQIGEDLLSGAWHTSIIGTGRPELEA